MVVSLSWMIKMSGLDEVLITDGGTVEGGLASLQRFGRWDKLLKKGNELS